MEDIKKMTRVAVWMISVITMTSGMGVVCGQDYPSKPVRIVTSSVGGGSDFVARQIAQGISSPLGQQVIVDNRPSGVIPGETVAKAPPDGYTLLVAGGILWMGPLLQKTPYDPVRDFSPISLTATSPNVLVVHPSLPVKSVKELIALAKARPGELNYGSGVTGGSTHLGVELLKSMAGVNIVQVPYKGGAQTLTGLVSGEVHMTITDVGLAAPHTKSGRLRALAVTSAQPSALAPGLPTVAASGLPGYYSENIIGMFAPAKTAPAIINRLNQEIARVLTRPDVKQRVIEFGAETVTNSPDEFAAIIKSDMAKIGKVIRDANIKVD